MRRIALALVANLALAAAHPSLALAQPDRDSPAFKPCGGPARSADRAKKLFQVGKDSYDEGDYTRAVGYWLDAFENDCTAVKLLLNLANAYERLGNVEGAIASLETYLSRKPDDPDAPSIQRRIERLKERRRASAATATTARPPTSPQPTPLTSPSSGAPSASSANVSATPSEPSVPAADEAHTSKGPGVAPWILTGVGGAAVVTGVVLYLSGQSKVNDASTLCTEHTSAGELKCVSTSTKSREQLKQEAQDLSDTGTQRKTMGGVVAGAGLAAVAGGVLWGVLGRHHAATTGAWLAPNAAPGFAGLAAGGRF